MRKLVALLAPVLTVSLLLGVVSSAQARPHHHRAACKTRHGHRHRARRCRKRHGPLARMAGVNRRHKTQGGGGNGQGGSGSQSGGNATPVSTQRPGDSPPVSCNLFASPNGSDGGGDGSQSHPFSSVRKLADSLQPGQTGCLRGGTYGSTSTLHWLTHSGTSSARITISSYPGETATVVGWVAIDASYVTFSHLRIDGSNNFFTGHNGDGCPNGTSQALSINGQNDILEYDDYFQSVASMRGVGVGIGFAGLGHGDNTVVRYSKIHDVGQCQAYDHLMYLSHGNNVQIYDNWLWGDPHGRGVQLYPAPTNARVFENVVDGAGEGFVVGNESGDTVAGNQIFNNVVTGEVGLPWQNISGEMIHDLYGGAPGVGNSFHDNLGWGNPGGVGPLTAVSSYNNQSANPQFVNGAGHNYQVQSSSPAAGWGLWNGSGTP